jgi:hypothetical protein
MTDAERLRRAALANGHHRSLEKVRDEPDTLLQCAGCEDEGASLGAPTETTP